MPADQEEFVKKVQELRAEYAAATERADKPAAAAALRRLLELVKRQEKMEGWLGTAVGPAALAGDGPNAAVGRLAFVFGPTTEVDGGLEKLVLPDLALSRVQVWLYDYAPKENETGNCKSAMASVMPGNVIRYSGRLILPEYRATFKAGTGIPTGGLVVDIGAGRVPGDIAIGDPGGGVGASGSVIVGLNIAVWSVTKEKSTHR
ncbi:hypothetical protein AYO44_13610 [Planctomycetaceae bacterium SCGC AG-212-F19]|nr:hypothetical protein AYO44_13610 [Planctomycetaceae bacterium SCGC AG-212-F19]